MGKSFGEKLRSERLDRHLTQAELGNGTLRAREVSLLESGRREPGPGAVRLLSGRLAAAAGGSGDGGDGALFLELSARQALDERDYPASCAQAEAAAHAALAAGDTGTWWSMTYLAAASLHAAADYRGCIAATAGLARHPLALERAGFKAQAETLLAAAYQGIGELQTAVVHARAAVAAVSGPAPGAPVFQAAAEALAAALAEAGRLDEAWEYCRTLLLPLLEAGISRQMKGKVFWTAGNVAFRRGDPGTGLLHHRAAAGLLAPGTDVELWARFNSSTAAARLAAGIHDGETLTCIEHAAAATSAVGLHGPVPLEVDHSRALWLDLNGEHVLAVTLLTEVYARRAELPPQTAAEVALHLGRALARSGRADAGTVYLADSEQSFRSVGAGDRAAHAAALAHEITAG